MRRKLAAGNWKMNGGSSALSEVGALVELVRDVSCDVLLCPPATLIDRVSAIAADSALSIGGQDCHVEQEGAHTGDISASMLLDAGASYVILGHSERRADHDETSEEVCTKAHTALKQGLSAIICVGETLDQRDAGQTLDIIGEQIAASVPDAARSAEVVIAYEPVWAIGTGRTPTVEQIGEVHDFLRNALTTRFGEDGAAFRLLYGGSVKAANAVEIFAVENVDGALVGGASLKAADFAPIIAALDA